MFGRRKKQRDLPVVASIPVARSKEGMNEQIPVVKETPMPFPPMVWVAIGILYVILGVIQSFFAALWRWWFGVALGFGCAKTGSSLIGIGLTGAIWFDSYLKSKVWSKMATCAEIATQKQTQVD